MLSSKRCKLRFIKKVATRNISDFLLETAAAAEWSADNPLGNRRHRPGAGTLNPAPLQLGNTETTSKIIVLTSAIAAKMRKVKTFLIFYIWPIKVKIEINC